MSSSTSDTRQRDRRSAAGPGRRGSSRRSRLPRRTLRLIWTALVVAICLVALALIFNANQAPAATAAGAGGTDPRYPYVAGRPGQGRPAPGFALPSTDGQAVALDDYQGQTVLLYFQEGLMCQPCWDQLRDIEQRWDDFSAVGIDSAVTITNDPLNALRQKVALEGLESPVLSDRDLSVSETYDTNKYGMMGGTTNGHTFIVVGPEGEIQWRADYGGAPKYTMYLPVDALLADLKAGLGAGADASGA